MKTKQIKEEQDKNTDEETVIEPKTRARKKASDIINDEKNKPSQDEPKTSKDTKRTQAKPRAIVKKRPLGIRKALRSKKGVAVKEKVVKNVIKSKRGRKPAVKTEPEITQDKETTLLISAAEIKKEPIEETSPNSRSSSPKTAGRRVRVSSDMAMMKTMLSDTPSTLVLGPRTSPYSMRSERSNSPSQFEAKNLRTGKPRKVKNLLSEVVIKEQKKRRRLLSDSKNPDASEVEQDCKKLKRGRSCSRDGSEISKCSDNTESDLSMSETFNDSDSKETNKKLDKSKTDLDVDIENSIQIPTIEKVPSLNTDSKSAETTLEPETSIVNETKKKSSLQRSTSLDSDNNNSNRLKLDALNSSDVEDKLLMKTENDKLFAARSNILTSMSRTFNSKEMSKNIRRARRGRKAAAEARRPIRPPAPKAPVTSTITEPLDDKHETIETLSKDIDDLIKNLDQNIDGDHEMTTEATTSTPETVPLQSEAKPVAKFYGLTKPLNSVDDNSIAAPETPVKDKEAITTVSNENTPSKLDDSENIRLHYEEDSVEKSDGARSEITYKCNTVASIDKLMDRLKEFEEFDKRRQRQESESKPSDSKPVMVTSDVVLIHKSGAEFKPLDMQSVRSPERTIEKENVLSCFENNSAISIVKRDQVRRSVDIDLPNSVTLIKRNSVSARKESTSSNHSRESDAISIFEKSLGKDVTLTEIRKSVDKSGTSSQMDLHQFASLHPANSSQTVAGVMLDSSQISITPRVAEPKIAAGDVQLIAKRKSRDESLSRKSSESTNEDDKTAAKEKMKSPPHQSPAVSITPAPVAIKSPEAVPIEAEAPPPPPPPPSENTKPNPDEIPITAETLIVNDKPETIAEEIVQEITKVDEVPPETKAPTPDPEKEVEPEKMEVEEKLIMEETIEEKPVAPVEPIKEDKKQAEDIKPVKKSLRNSIESLPGPSNAFNETPESQKRKENVLRTLGLLTHKAAKEAKIEKAKEKERIISERMSNKGKASKSSGDYTGTLKTVIKLNRGGEKKKHRSSLKMTFQKSKYRSGKPALEMGEAAAEDSTFYTIERREIAAATSADGGQRKSHYSNRLNNHDTEPIAEPTEPKETLNLVIPEKASSFSIHPGRLCMDQCFYCGGKFGLFDTPCHIAQIKSSERQKKVLDNEEKLTIDSCLCDACYRHVDRRANCPSYRKRPLPKHSDIPAPRSPPAPSTDKPSSPPAEEESESDGTGRGEGAGAGAGAGAGRVALCHTEACAAAADYSIRRKWLIKMRSSVNKVLKLKGDYPGLHTIPLCAAHHRAVSPLMACLLCRRRLTKHHNIHFIHHGYTELNPLLRAANLPVQFEERPVLCKGCRYYCSLLQRPGHNDGYANGYRRKLLQIYNIEVPPEPEGVFSDMLSFDDPTKLKKKQRNKSKQRKSMEPDMSSENSSEKTSESTPEKDQAEKPIEEDIESLISSNKILVPGAVKIDVHPSDGSDENSEELPALLSKQTELQYLLQKQNNPAQFLQGQPNLTQKQRNILKLQTVSGIQKPAQQHRICEKNAKKLHKLGQLILNKEKIMRSDEMEIFEEKSKDGVPVLKNITLNDECTIESIPTKRTPDINTLKNKWQMSESFTQVKKNLSELSKKLTVEKDPKKTDVKYSNPVKRLETNPSISVRELFPGEEEMNLQCSIEFNNVKGVTPEGWEKCNTTIQYDTETKRLWNELQRPYGNQSSFLRHLVLLEKYFRSGDLMLSHNASPPAANYSDSVQSRLRAYDNIVNDTPRRAEPAISLIEYRKKPSINGKSLLKSNQMEDKETKKFMPPPSGAPKLKSKDKSKKQLPPELIAINTPNAQGRKAIQNVLHNIQQLVKGVSASDPTEVATSPLPAGLVPALPVPVSAPKLATPTMPKPDPAPAKEKTPKKSDTPKKSKNSSKPWRPTLMPITPENLSKIAREPTQLAVDGRSLPSLVQVMSSGKRYHITLQDYNKMCHMRREKLQQLQGGEKKQATLDESAVVTELQPSTMLGNGGSVTQITSEEKREDYSGSNAATILKNVGLRNITIAPIPAKTSTITSPTPTVSSPSLIMTSTPIKIPQLGSSVSITSETVLTPNLPLMTSTMIMPKIPKSLTVIPQTVMASLPQNIVMTTPQVLQSDGTRP